MDSNHQNHHDEEAFLNALLLPSAHVLPFVLNTAIELDLFNIMAKSGPGAYVSASEIASQLPTKNPDASFLLDRMLHLFVTHSLLSYASKSLENGLVEKTYSLTPTANFFIGKVEDGNISFVSRLAFHRASIETWLNMKDVILEGGNLFERTHGVSIFEYVNKHDELNYIFNQAMIGASTPLMNGVFKKYKGFEGVDTLVDVGGGTGRVLNMIISKYHSIKGINFDLPQVVQNAPTCSGIEHIGGSMFEFIPKGDAIMIKDACHNWSDENVIKVLKNIYEALPKNGKLIIMSILMPETPEMTKASQIAANYDNIMLTQLSGKERTAKEFEALAMAVGFCNFRVACVPHAHWVIMESYK